MDLLQGEGVQGGESAESLVEKEARLKQARIQKLKDEMTMELERDWKNLSDERKVKAEVIIKLKFLILVSK